MLSASKEKEPRFDDDDASSRIIAQIVITSSSGACARRAMPANFGSDTVPWYQRNQSIYRLHSASDLPPLERLHGTQAATRLSSSCVPPRITGTTWSHSNRTPHAPQYLQV